MILKKTDNNTKERQLRMQVVLQPLAPFGSLVAWAAATQVQSTVHLPLRNLLPRQPCPITYLCERKTRMSNTVSTPNKRRAGKVII